MGKYRVKVIVAAGAKGEVLKSDSPLSFLGGVDPMTGEVIEEGHPLRGRRVQGKILAIPHGRGSTVGSYVIYSLVSRGLAPVAILMKEMDMIVATGCVLGGVPLAIVRAGVWGQLRDGGLAELDPSSSSLIVSE
jgi:hypothetical protein